jgi:hypothetical protein
LESLQQATFVAETNLARAALRMPFVAKGSFCAVGPVGIQFLGAIDTVRLLSWRLPQLAQRSFRSRSISLVYGGRPCWRREALILVRPPQTGQAATMTCHARRSLSRIA